MRALQPAMDGRVVPRSTAGSVYAIIFLIDADALETVCPSLPSEDAAMLVRSFLEQSSFREHSAGIYFGDATIDAVQCVLTAQKLARRYSWFAPSVRELRMLRVEEDCDLSAALYSDSTRAKATQRAAAENSEMSSASKVPLGRPRVGEVREKPWEDQGISRATYFRRQKEKRA